MGFRGDEPPANFDSALRIITIRGSTTESLYIADGKTWSDVLSDGLKSTFEDAWLNNAGLDGHSTFGHLVFMEDHVKDIRPDLAVFLVGANDRNRRGYAPSELNQIKGGISVVSITGFVKSFVPYSEVASLALNVYCAAKPGP